MHIILIEPDKLLASTYSQALEQSGQHKVSVVHDAQSAIDVADRQAPELVILELQLIEHNGIEFLYEFRSYPEWQKVPVIVHSWTPLDTHSAENLKQKLYITTCLYKPQTSLRQLLASVNQHSAIAS